MKFLKIFLYISFCINVTSCTSILKEPRKYEFLFEKTLGGGKSIQRFSCIGAYYTDEFLVIANRAARYRDSTYLSIYDRKTGMFAVTSIKNRDSFHTHSCSEIKFTYINSNETTFYYLQSAGFRDYFNFSRAEPERLKNVITAPQFYFRSDGKWKGEKTVEYKSRKIIKNLGSIDDIIEHLVKLRNSK